MTKLESHVEGLWDALVRQLTPANVAEMVKDSKVESSDGKLYFYVPRQHLKRAQELFSAVEVRELAPCSEPAGRPSGRPAEAHSGGPAEGPSKGPSERPPKGPAEAPKGPSEAERPFKGPPELSPLEPGLLSLEWSEGHPLPYCVPGGRFNEMYGWDSYFIVLGLLESGRTDLATAMLLHQCFEIDHYGKILNANRSYYLNRSQPPFLSDMALRVYAATQDKALLERGISHAIKEYHNVWMSEPRIDPRSGLSRYRPPSTGKIPLEVEKGHFDHVLGPLAAQQGLSIQEFTAAYNSNTLECPQLDEYLQHDLGVREAGHDTSTRLHEVCADLATIDLNCLLYKYEIDIARALEILGPGQEKDRLSSTWTYRARQRQTRMLELMWDDNDSLFYDYNTNLQEKHHIRSDTCLWTLWSGVCPPELAARLVPRALDLFEHKGGLAGSEPLETHRQWDYPAGWAPHQIMAWKGLADYGYTQEARRLAAKWVAMVDAIWQQHGLIFEKYNVVDCTHGVDAEYGNQGTFSEGFGWTNASVLLAREYTCDK